MAQLYKTNDTPIYTNGGIVDKIESFKNSTYHFSTWSDQSMYFYYQSMKVGKGKTNCYVKLSFYNAKTGKPIPTKGNNKVDFYVTR